MSQPLPPTGPSAGQPGPQAGAAQPTLEEIQRAIADVQRIRGVLNASRHSHVLRRVFRPALMFGFLSGPTIAIFAGLMECVHKQAQVKVWGVPKVELLWLLGGACLLANAVFKMIFFRLAAQREGYSLGQIMQQVYRPDYLRVFLPMLLLCVVLCVAVAQLGAPGMIVGIITMTMGAVWVMLPLALPVPEGSVLGWYFLIGGVFALFVLPAYPFAKVAVLWGLGVGGIMPLGYWAAGDGGRGDGAGAPPEPVATPKEE